jgi:hypothetical protein
MTPGQINVAIAESVGYPNPRPGAFRRIYAGEIPRLEECPNYRGDLNAIYEVVMSLDIVQKRAFAESITDITEGPGDVWGDEFALINATAQQRCEAYLRTIGKWEEGK